MVYHWRRLRLVIGWESLDEFALSWGSNGFSSLFRVEMRGISNSKSNPRNKHLQ